MDSELPGLDMSLKAISHIPFGRRGKMTHSCNNADFGSRFKFASLSNFPAPVITI